MPTEAETRALVDAVWETLCDLGPESLTVSEIARANLRIAYEPFRTAYDPEDLAPPPFSLARAQAFIAAAEQRERLAATFGPSGRPPFNTLVLQPEADDTYSLHARQYGHVAGPFKTEREAHDHIAATYGVTPAQAKSGVPMLMLQD